MPTKYVYLAGPIAGRSKNEANNWRYRVAHLLINHGIVAISPLRCEPINNAGIYDIPLAHYGQIQDPRFGSSRAIGNKNRFDIKSTDMLLAYMPEEFPLSLGTLGEIFWA